MSVYLRVCVLTNIILVIIYSSCQTFFLLSAYIFIIQPMRRVFAYGNLNHTHIKLRMLAACKSIFIYICRFSFFVSCLHWLNLSINIPANLCTIICTTKKKTEKLLKSWKTLSLNVRYTHIFCYWCTGIQALCFCRPTLHMCRNTYSSHNEWLNYSCHVFYSSSLFLPFSVCSWHSVINMH